MLPVSSHPRRVSLTRAERSGGLYFDLLESRGLHSIMVLVEIASLLL